MRDCPTCQATYHVEDPIHGVIVFVGGGLLYCGMCGTLYNMKYIIDTPRYYKYFCELQETIKEEPPDLTKSCVKSINQFTNP